MPDKRELDYDIGPISLGSEHGYITNGSGRRTQQPWVRTRTLEPWFRQGCKTQVIWIYAPARRLFLAPSFLGLEGDDWPRLIIIIIITIIIDFTLKIKSMFFSIIIIFILILIILMNWILFIILIIIFNLSTQVLIFFNFFQKHLWADTLPMGPDARHNLGSGHGP
jgi:hypothetical protein